MSRPELAGVPGVPETLLSRAVLAGLPANLAPAPWTVRCSAVVWLGRAGDAAAEALPPGLRSSARALAVVGGLVRYQETPVGAYDEVLGLVAARSGRSAWCSVAFMAVDSAASLVGGRTNWSLPKTLAGFEGAPRTGGTMTARSAAGGAGGDWRVAATPHPFGPALPAWARVAARQQFHDGRVGRSVLSARGRVRPALVTIEVESEGPLPTWLRPGRHPGAHVEEATFTLGPPTFP